MSPVPTTTNVDAENTRFVFSAKQLFSVGALLVAASLGWAAMAAHAASDGHPPLKNRAAKIEEIVLGLEAWRQTHQAVGELERRHTDHALAKLTSTVDSLVRLQAAQMAERPVKSDAGRRARAARIRENLARGDDPLAGL